MLQPRNKVVRVPVRFPKDLHDKIRKLAFDMRTSINAIAVSACYGVIEKQEKIKKATK